MCANSATGGPDKSWQDAWAQKETPAERIERLDARAKRIIETADRWKRGHAVACAVHDDEPCSRLPGCLQDGR